MVKKYQISAAGSYEQLKIIQESMPVPGEEEVLVETIAIGVNFADTLVRIGVYESAKKLVGWPITPGFEFSGKVIAVGARVKNHQVGDLVFGLVFFGAYATHIVAKSDQVFTIPKNVSAIEMAGFLAVYLTAFHCLNQIVRIYPKSTVLIHSAAGGVGTALVQLSREYGYNIVAVVGSARKVEYVRALGVDRIILRSDKMWAEISAAAPEGYDVIFDANGSESFKKGYRLLKPTGKLICYGSHSLLSKKGGRLNYAKALWGMWKTPKFNPLSMITHNKTVSGFNLSFLFSRKDLIEECVTSLMGLLAQGKIKPLKVTEFAFGDAASAHRLIESGESVSKIVLKV